MHLIKTVPLKRHKSVARLFDEDFGRRNDEVRKKAFLPVDVQKRRRNLEIIYAICKLLQKIIITLRIPIFIFQIVSPPFRSAGQT